MHFAKRQIYTGLEAHAAMERLERELGNKWATLGRAQIN